MDNINTAATLSDVTPGTLQQFTTLLLERMATTHLPEMGGMIRLHGRWTDPGRPTGKFYYGAKVVDDGGSQAKVEIHTSLVAGSGVAPGQRVIVTGRLAIRNSNYGVEVRLVGSDISLDANEQEETVPRKDSGRMTLERLRSLPVRRTPFPTRTTVSVTLIHSSSSISQVTHDCMAELDKIGTAIEVLPVRVNILDPVEIAESIRYADGDVLVLIRGGGDAADFEVFDDPRVLTALAQHPAHRVIGLGHTGNTTLLDFVSDYSANTPAQAGAYIREQIEKQRNLQGETAKALSLATERVRGMERERVAILQQLQTANALLAKAQNGLPKWVAVAAFVTGVLVMTLLR